MATLRVRREDISFLRTLIDKTNQNLTKYFSIWNVYRRKNLAFYFWNSLENHLDRENQWGVLPVLGIEYEF